MNDYIIDRHGDSGEAFESEQGCLIGWKIFFFG